MTPKKSSLSQREAEHAQIPSYIGQAEGEEIVAQQGKRALTNEEDVTRLINSHWSYRRAKYHAIYQEKNNDEK